MDKLILFVSTGHEFQPTPAKKFTSAPSSFPAYAAQEGKSEVLRPGAAPLPGGLLEDIRGFQGGLGKSNRLILVTPPPPPPQKKKKKMKFDSMISLL